MATTSVPFKRSYHWVQFNEKVGDIPQRSITMANTDAGFFGKNWRLFLDNGKWDVYELDKTCCQIEIWKLEILNAQKNDKKRILPQISNIYFTNLKKIRVFNNRIQSVECLIRIGLPLLQMLSIGYNNLTNIEILKKADWPHLKEFSCQKNYVFEKKVLSLTDFKNVQKLQLDRNRKKSVNQMSWLLKSNIKNLKKLKTIDPSRIEQEDVFERIGKKWPQIEISSHYKL